MSWQQIVLVVYFATNAVGGVFLIDLPRQPLTRGAWFVTAVVYALLIWMAVSL